MEVVTAFTKKNCLWQPVVASAFLIAANLSFLMKVKFSVIKNTSSAKISNLVAPSEILGN